MVHMTSSFGDLLEEANHPRVTRSWGGSALEGPPASALEAPRVYGAEELLGVGGVMQCLLVKGRANYLVAVTLQDIICSPVVVPIVDTTGAVADAEAE